MDNESLYDLLDEVLERASKEQIKMFLTKVVNKFPDKIRKYFHLLMNSLVMKSKTLV